MKATKILIVILLITGAIACEPAPKPEQGGELLGSWKWLNSSGGIGGWTETPESTGQNIRIEITKERYLKYINDTLEADMSYSLDIDTTGVYSRDSLLIRYENGHEQTYRTQGDTLYLIDAACLDCYGHTYKKITGTE